MKKWSNIDSIFFDFLHFFSRMSQHIPLIFHANSPPYGQDKPVYFKSIQRYGHSYFNLINVGVRVRGVCVWCEFRAFHGFPWRHQQHHWALLIKAEIRRHCACTRELNFFYFTELSTPVYKQSNYSPSIYLKYQTILMNTRTFALDTFLVVWFVSLSAFNSFAANRQTHRSRKKLF